MEPLQLKIMRARGVLEKATGECEDCWATTALDITFYVRHVKGKLLSLTFQDNVTNEKVTLMHDDVAVLKWVLRHYRVQPLGRVEVIRA